MKPNIGIVGGGFVGGAIAKGFGLYANVKIYDKDPKRSVHSLDEVCKSDYIFLCLPTPMEHIDGGKADLSILRSVCSELKNRNCRATCIIKSTVPIGTTESLEEEFEFALNFVHNPEFLTARNADIDYLTPSRIILGGRKHFTAKVAEIFADRFPGANILQMTSRESEAVKYVANCFFAVKVMYFNEVYLGLKKLGNIDWDTVMGGVLTDGRIGVSHHQVPGHDGKFGFSGLCVLPSATLKSWKHDCFEEPEIHSIEEFSKQFEQKPNNERWHWCVEGVNSSADSIEWKKVTEVTERIVDEELYEFHTENGIFTCTAEHLMPVLRNEKLSIIPASEIEKKYFFFAKKIGIEKISLEKITKRAYKGKVYNMELAGDDNPEDDLFWIEQKTGIVGHNCFPKDICALINQFEEKGFDPLMMKACWEHNKLIRPEMDWGRIPGAVSGNT